MTHRLPAGINCVARSTTGSPTTGTWEVGDTVQDSVGEYWRCTVAGTPGTWVNLNANAFFAETRNTTAPNATIPAHRWQPLASESNVDLVIEPKGQGALISAVPDSTASGGNKRGTAAVDLQRGRDAAASVAAGNYSVVAGGYDNAASGLYGAVLGGYTNECLGQAAVILGGQNNSTAENYATVAGGQDNVAQHLYSLAHGYKAITKGTDSRVLGTGLAVDTAGGSQYEEQAYTLTTTAVTATPFVDAGANTITLNDHESVAVHALIGASQDGATANYACYNVEFCARRQSGVATTAIVGTTAVRAQESNTVWNVTVTADTTNGGININAVGVAATTIRWTCVIHMVRRLRVT